MKNSIKTTEDFFNACKGKSISYKLQAIENLNKGIETRGNGLWDDEHSHEQQAIDLLKLLNVEFKSKYLKASI